jgi:AraC-like DNA-binding protein
MIFCRHIPRPPLGRFIDWLWYYDDCYPPHRREHVLPDGTFELVIDLRDEPRKLFDRTNLTRYQAFRRGWLSGTHSEYLVIDALPNSSMIGAHFKPGGAAAFLGVPAHELNDKVIEVEAIWGGSARDLRERLLAAPRPEMKFRLLEDFLMGGFTRMNGAADRSPRVAWALHEFLQQPHVNRISAVADRLGVSHKHFIEEFRKHVGLTPKRFCRIQRFQRVLAQIQRQRTIAWADLACSCGYFDQAHFVNDFHAFAGLNPSVYLRHELDDPNFVPVPD